MNLTLFRATAKANWVLLIIILVVLFMYLSIIISMFDPESMESIAGMMDAIPRELAAAMGMAEITTDLTSFIASFYYRFIALLFPTIFCIILANRLVAKHVDSGSMAYLLSTPNSRLRVVFTQAILFLVSITIIFIFLTITGIGMSAALFPGHLNISAFLLINLMTMSAFYAISGIGFCFSCIFDETKYSLAFGAGIPIAFFVLNMLGNVREDYAWIGGLSLFSLLDYTKIIAEGTLPMVSVTIPAGIAIIMYATGITIFNRRSLPL